MKVIACYKGWKEKEIEVDDKYTYLEKEWADFTEEEKVSCEKDIYELHDKVLLILEKEPDFYTLESIYLEKTGEIMCED